MGGPQGAAGGLRGAAACIQRGPWRGQCRLLERSAKHEVEARGRLSRRARSARVRTSRSWRPESTTRSSRTSPARSRSRPQAATAGASRRYVRRAPKLAGPRTGVPRVGFHGRTPARGPTGTPLRAAAPVSAGARRGSACAAPRPPPEGARRPRVPRARRASVARMLPMACTIAWTANAMCCAGLRTLRTLHLSPSSRRRRLWRGARADRCGMR